MITDREVKRGDIYYIHQFPTVGCEQRSGRPAVIVSNNKNNACSEIFEVAFMTLKVKPNLPTHVFVDRGPCINSTILCEQVTTVSKDRLGDYMCHIPEHLEEPLNEAVAISLGLPHLVSQPEGGIEINLIPSQVLDELNAYKHDCASLKKENDSIKEHILSVHSALESANTKAEMYERMYNDLLDRLMKRG